MNKLQNGQPHEFEEVTLFKNAKRGERTFKVRMTVTDRDSLFMAKILSELNGRIIGYRRIDSDQATRDFGRIISVDQVKKIIKINPVSFGSKTSLVKEAAVITEHCNNIVEIPMLDIADVVPFSSNKKDKIQVAK